MRGRVKTGEGTLVGNAGEFYVVAELLKRGAIAALAPRNSPSFDIFATKENKGVRIRVKTKSEEYDDWQWMAKKDGKIFRALLEHDDFTVLVNLTNETKDLQFFILPTHTLDMWLSDDFSRWVSTCGKNNRLHDPKNKKRCIKYSKYKDRLQDYWDNWDMLWK